VRVETSVKGHAGVDAVGIERRPEDHRALAQPGVRADGQLDAELVAVVPAVSVALPRMGCRAPVCDQTGV
jgi:hypothetical protein